MLERIIKNSVYFFFFFILLKDTNVLYYIHLMVQQKIVMKVEMTCEKCRSKAMKIAAAAQGVKLCIKFQLSFAFEN